MKNEDYQYLAGEHLEEGEEVVPIPEVLKQVSTAPTSLGVRNVNISLSTSQVYLLLAGTCKEN